MAPVHASHQDQAIRAPNTVVARRLGIDAQHEAIIFMRRDCEVCRSEGFIAHARVELTSNGRSVIATLFQVTSDLVQHGEAALSDSAWRRLALQDGDRIGIGHPRPLESLRDVRGKVYGQRFSDAALNAVMTDIAAGRYDEIELSAFITACSSGRLDAGEVKALTHAMVDVGERLRWPGSIIVDKHCVGGLPGNRTTPIVVAITTALGLVMPKTSSRAITSPAGTADAMETMAPVELDLAAMRRVVDAEGGCIVWGGAVRLSPADDILIRVERALDLDSEGQLVASVLSKKIAAGATHLVLDIPVGPTAKVRSPMAAELLSASLTQTAASFGLQARVVLSDGTQPVGRGIGPALEAEDVLAVLQNAPGAPQDLRQRAILLAGALIEMAGKAPHGSGSLLAAHALDDGSAWAKFQRICEAQGGMRAPPKADWRRDIVAEHSGRVVSIDNRRLAKAAKLAGAPAAPAAGINMRVRVGDTVAAGEPLFVLQAQTVGELDYALAYLAANPDIIRLEQA